MMSEIPNKIHRFWIWAGRIFVASTTSRWVLLVAVIVGGTSVYLAYEFARSAKRLNVFFETLAQDPRFVWPFRYFFRWFGFWSTEISYMVLKLVAWLAFYLDRLVQVVLAILLVLAAVAIVNLIHPVVRKVMPKSVEFTENPWGPRAGPRLLMAIIWGYTTGFVILLQAPPKLLETFWDISQERLDTAFFLWAGLVAVAVLLYLRTCAPFEESSPAPPTDPAPLPSPPSLKEAYDRLRARDMELNILGGNEPKSPPRGRKRDQRPQPDPSRVVERIRELYGLDAKSTRNFRDGLKAIGEAAAGSSGIVIQEPLGPLHVRFLAEAIFSAQDRGGTTLVLCPAPEINEVRDQLSKAILQADPGRIHNKWSPPLDRIDPLDQWTFVIASEELVQDRILGARRDDFAVVLKQVRLLIVLDAAAFDPSILRIQLALLRAKMDARRVRYILQSTQRREPAEWASVLLGGDVRLELLRLRVSDSPAPQQAFYCIIFGESRPAADKLYRGLEGGGDAPNLPPAAGLFPTVLLDVARPGIRLRHWDPRQTHDRRLWEKFKNQLDRRTGGAGGEDEYNADLRRIKQPIVEDPVTDPVRSYGVLNPQDGAKEALQRMQTVWIAEDCHNVLDLLEDLSGIRIDGEAMALIVTTSYPLRKILASQQRVSRILNGQDDIFAPRAPLPKIGMRELAMLVLMRAIDGLPRDDAVRYFNDVADKTVLAHYRISPTRLGLKTLLELQFSGGLQQQRARIRFDIETKPLTPKGDDDLGRTSVFESDYIFGLVHHDRVPEGISPFLPVVPRGFGDRSIGHVRRDDYGLAYTVASCVLLDGNYYLIEEVRQDRVLVGNVDPYNMYRFIQTGFTFLFWRGYWFDDAAAFQPMVLGPLVISSAGVMEYRLIRAFLPMVRQTYGFFVHDTGQQQQHDRPLIDARLLPPTQHAKHDIPLGHCLVLRLQDAGGAVLDPAEIGPVAFTLAVTLQDLIEALFPGIGHRVAVLSPQSEPTYSNLFGAPGGTLEHVLARRWPHLVEGLISERPIAAKGEKVAAWLDRVACGTTAVSADTNAVATLSSIHIVIVEDWPWDLGVIGRIHQDSQDIFKAWREYLDWNNANQSEPDLYYRIGTRHLHEAFAFKAACNLVAQLVALAEEPDVQRPDPS